MNGAAEGRSAGGSLAVVEVAAGVCGHKTTATAESTGAYNVKVQLESDCPQVQKSALIKAVEVAAGLALPKDVTMKISKVSADDRAEKDKKD